MPGFAATEILLNDLGGLLSSFETWALQFERLPPSSIQLTELSCPRLLDHMREVRRQNRFQPKTPVCVVIAIVWPCTRTDRALALLSYLVSCVTGLVGARALLEHATSDDGRFFKVRIYTRVSGPQSTTLIGQLLTNSFTLCSQSYALLEKHELIPQIRWK